MERNGIGKRWMSRIRTPARLGSYRQFLTQSTPFGESELKNGAGTSAAMVAEKQGMAAKERALRIPAADFGCPGQASVESCNPWFQPRASRDSGLG